MSCSSTCRGLGVEFLVHYKSWLFRRESTVSLGRTLFRAMRSSTRSRYLSVEGADLLCDRVGGRFGPRVGGVTRVRSTGIERIFYSDRCGVGGRFGLGVSGVTGARNANRNANWTAGSG